MDLDFLTTTTMLAVLLTLASATAALAQALPQNGAIVRQEANVCLDNTWGDLSDGNQIQVYECFDTAPNQQWTWQPSSTIDDEQYFNIRFADKCVGFQVPSHGNAAGVPVTIAPCEGGDWQRDWRWVGDNICSTGKRCMRVGTGNNDKVTIGSDAAPFVQPQQL